MSAEGCALSLLGWACPRTKGAARSVMSANVCGVGRVLLFLGLCARFACSHAARPDRLAREGINLILLLR